jgi:hypothetical protein
MTSSTDTVLSYAAIINALAERRLTVPVLITCLITCKYPSRPRTVAVGQGESRPALQWLACPAAFLASTQDTP